MKIKFLNSIGQELILDSAYTMDIDDIEFNAELNEPLYGEISSVIGSLTPKKDRKITIEIPIAKRNDVNFRNEILKFFTFFDRSKAPFYIIDYENNIEYSVILKSVKNLFRESEGLELRFSKMKLEFLMIDPFPRSINETTHTYTINNANVLNFAINNISILNYPVIEIISSNPFASLEIKSEKNYILLNTNFYLPNNKIVLDSYNTEAYMIDVNNNKTDISIFIEAGGLPILYPDMNNFQFIFSNNVNASVYFKYKLRYIV